jgi:hypothetical protein
VYICVKNEACVVVEFCFLGVGLEVFFCAWVASCD